MSERHAGILRSFDYHKPTESQVARIASVRRIMRMAAIVIIDLTPDGPDQTAALRQLHEAMMTANKSIVCETPETAIPTT